MGYMFVLLVLVGNAYAITSSGISPGPWKFDKAQLAYSFSTQNKAGRLDTPNFVPLEANQYLHTVRSPTQLPPITYNGFKPLYSSAPNVVYIQHKGESSNEPAPAVTYSILPKAHPPASSYSLKDSYELVPKNPSSNYGTPTKHYSKPHETYNQPPAPSATYGTPSKPSETYGTPSKPRANYGPPSHSSESYSPPSKPRENYGPPSKPSESYGPPSKPSESYGPPSKPSESYGPPSKPSESYGPPSEPSESYNPESSYGPPAPPANYGPPTEYGPAPTPKDEIKFIIYKPKDEEVIKETLTNHAHENGDKIKFIHGPNLEIKHNQKIYLPPPKKSVIYILLKEPEIHTKVQVMGSKEEAAKPEVFIIYETKDGVIRKHYDLTEEESRRVVSVLGDKMRLGKRESGKTEEKVEITKSTSTETSFASSNPPKN